MLELPQGDVASSVVRLPIQWDQALINGASIAWLDLDCMLVSLPGISRLTWLRALIFANRRIIVYSPQIIENYQLQSGEGLSLLFVYTWLLGDVCNLGGAALAHLLPTMIILGVYASAYEYGFCAVYLIDLSTVYTL